MVSKVVLGEQLSGYNFAIKFFSVYKIFSSLKFIYVSILILKLNKKNANSLFCMKPLSTEKNFTFQADSCNNASRGEKKFGLNCTSLKLWLNILMIRMSTKGYKLCKE